MKTKYREAVANLAKQSAPKKNKQIDPLSSICAEVRKTKFISKQMLAPPAYQSLFQKKNSANESQRQVKPKRKVFKARENKELQKIQNTFSSEWIRFLPQECDQFDEEPDMVTHKKDIVGIVSPSNKTNEKSANQAIQEEEPPKFNIQTFNIDEFKRKLGIGVKVQEPKVESTEQKNDYLKQEEKKPSILPFAGRPFEQAPAKPVPKKIHEYPPTCKVAGIYQWPPPKSEYRRWKAQMKESRKLK